MANKYSLLKNYEDQLRDAIVTGASFADKQKIAEELNKAKQQLVEVNRELGVYADLSEKLKLQPLNQ